MFDTSSIPDLSRAVLAVGSLGTASFGLVDATKSLGGGISNRGFGDIRKVIAKLIPPGPTVTSPVSDSQSKGAARSTSAVPLPAVLETLRANWLNGMTLPDQKAVAKAMVKLNLNPNTVAHMATATGVDSEVLKSIAEKIAVKGVTTASSGSTAETKLSAVETDVFGRFDLVLNALLDQGYQRGDQRYRNSAKALAVLFSILLAFIGNYSLGMQYQNGTVLLVGLLATPLAPVAKDLASAIQAGAKAVQVLRN